MYKKNIYVIIFIIFFVNYSLYADLNLSLEGEVQTAPWFYEPVYQIDGSSLSTSWLLGLNLDNFLIGLNLFSDYVSMDGKNPQALLKGAWFNLGANASLKVRVFPLLTFVLESGLLWNQSSFDYNQSGWLGRPLLGYDLIFRAQYHFNNLFSFELNNRLDLYLSGNDFLGDSYYRIGTRVYFDPGLGFLKAFAELDASYWNYTSDILASWPGSWLFQAQLGCYLQWHTKNDRSENTADNSIKLNELIHRNTTDEANKDLNKPNQADDNKIEDINYVDSEFEKLIKAKPGVSIKFYNMLFNETEISDDSLPVLDNLAKILLQFESLVISIHGYSKFLQDPQKELEICSNRANQIINYLISKGVNDKQIQQHPIGNIIMNDEYYISIDVVQNNN